MASDEDNARRQASRLEGIKKLQGQNYNCTQVDAMDFNFIPTPTPYNLNPQKAKGE